MMILALFSFLLQKDFSVCLAFFCPFSFSSSKRSWDISRVSFRSFSLLFWWYLLTIFIKKFLLVIYHFYHIYHIYKKIMKMFLTSFKTKLWKNMSDICYVDYLNYFLQIFLKNHLNFSKNLYEYIRRKNLRYNVIWGYSKNHLNRTFFVFTSF